MSDRDLFGDQVPQQRPIPGLPIVPLALKDFVAGHDGTPRIVDWRLAEVVENRHLASLRQITGEHHHDLEDYDTLYSRTIKSTGGRPGTEYRYTFKQAIFMVVISRGQNWKVLLRNIIEIYDMWKNGELVARDAAAEAKAESSIAKATEAAPEIMGTLFEKFQINLEQRIPELIANAVNANMRTPKALFTDATKRDICREWLRQNPTGLDLLCTTQIIDAQGKPIPGACEIHHMNGLARNSFEDGLPVLIEFHQKLTADRTENGLEWRQARTAHVAFLDKHRANKPRDIFDA